MRSIMFLLAVTFVAFATANEHFCPEKVLGNPTNECGLYGLAVLGKDEGQQATATRACELAIVKAGQCYTLFPDADVGDAFFTMDGKDISHVTYCGAAQPEPIPGDAPEVEPVPEPATCELVAQSSRTCKRLSKLKQHCTACVTSACRACREVFIKHCVHPTPVDSVEACLANRGGPCRKKKGKKARKCLNGLRRQCESHVCDQQPPTPEDAPEPVTPPVPAVCQLVPRSAKVCRKLAAAKEHCTSCVTTSCKLCRAVFQEFCEKPTPVASVDSCLAARGGPCLKKTGKKRERCLNGLRRQCEEHQCTKPAVPEVPTPEVPTPEVPAPPAPTPENPAPAPPAPTPENPAPAPPAAPQAPCVPRTKRRLKIRGEGKSCKDAPKIKRKVKELKSKVLCLLKALSGEIPKEKIVVDTPPPKVVHETIKIVKPGKWVKQPDEIIEKDVTRVINRRTPAPKPPVRPVKPPVRPVKPPVRPPVRPVKPPVKPPVRPTPNGRVVRRRRRRRTVRRRRGGRAIRRRRTRRRRTIRRRRRGQRVVRPRPVRPVRPTPNGRVVRRRRRRTRRRRTVRRRRGGRAIRRRRRTRRTVRRRRTRRRRGGRAIRRRRTRRVRRVRRVRRRTTRV